ncbi:MAG: T9SS type A sorting domain-containing protein [Ignavibacteriae bacterium]|nr:T9SS type A sorting domain-containing protein [Ignavibacteriota bacterium]
MKKITVFSILICAVIVFAFGFPGDKTDVMMVNNVVIPFEGTNANGNNLWLDNFSFGERYGNDLTITSIGMRDKNYLIPGVTSTNFSPVVTVLNAGRLTSGSATVTMTDQSAYNVTKTVSSLSAGATTTVTFDPITFNLNTSKNMKVYINWATDENHSNDTVNQATVFLPGVQKKILFEAHTATTCAPCASQNPSLDAFVQQHFDSIVAIKYHVWWPALGDPMYNANIPQARVRTYYNSISAVPTLTVDGVHQQVSGYTTLSNLLNPFNTRRSLASPIGITVTDTRLAGDTIKATININVVSALPSGVDYRLRINAIERKITYATPPGSNGETIFYDVFRRMYPSVTGIPINYAPGNYVVEYKYKRDAAWVDSMMYTAVFIQDEYTHEVINAAKGRNYYKSEKINQPSVVDNSVIPMTTVMSDAPMLAGNGLQVETMEVTVPPPGWSIINNDSNFTFWQYIYNPISGPSFPGVRAIRMSYYSYAENVGTKDFLRSKVYNNVNLSDSIKFDWAYAQRTPYEDRLVVKISVDGGNTFPYTIFDKQGAALGTAPPSSSSFVPTTGQWGTFAARYGAVTGLEPVSNFTPSKFELMQNYPNPFNPTTNIKYQISNACYVSMKVYDILGKEVATLVNANLKAGQYELQFNASNVPSGVYFYKIIAGNFTDVKKMLIVK